MATIERVEDSGSALSEGTVFETGDETAPAEPVPLERGSMLSRYMLVERVGLGGMGVVWAAYDPELDRKVAIKLLRPRSDRGRSELARTRLIREAQVMARVSHPNVIAIHDVGEHEGQVFLAMEFVQGKTLRRWVRTTRRDVKEIVAAFVQAGRGLAAAHRVGLVHRDFKPANVLVGPDGRARVLDFGLARSVEAPFGDDDPGVTESWSAARIQRLNPNPIVTPLTRTGSMVGTPAYMAPEQFEGGQFDARTDQFSFCVALWEALYGRRPFAGATIDELRRAVCEGRISSPPGDSRVPGVIDRALRRGLSVDPVARWPSMDALLAELSRDPASGRRRWLIGAAVVASFLAALIVTPMLGEPQVTGDPCPDPRAELDGIWDSARRQSLDEAALASGRAERWPRTAAALDRYASAYVAARDQACESGPELAAEAHARCLDDRLRALELAVELLGAGPRLRDDAPIVLASLPPLEACARPGYLEAAGFGRARDPRRDSRLRRAVIEARSAAGAGEAEQAAAQLLGLLREVDDDPRQRAEIQVELALIEGHSDPARARERLEQVVAEAVRASEDLLAARAATALIDVVGRELGEPEDGLRWAALAEAWSERLDLPGIEHARRLAAEGELLWARGEVEAAEANFERTLRLLGVAELELMQLDPPATGAASRALAGLARVALARDDLQLARAQLAAVHELQVAWLGVEHPEAARAALELALVEVELGDWRAAASGFAAAGQAMAPEQAVRAQLEHADFRLSRAELLPEEQAQVDPLVLEAVDAARSRSVEVERALLTFARLERSRGHFEQAEQLLASLVVGPALELALALERAELRLACSDPEQALAALEQAPSDRQGHELAELAAARGRALMQLGRSEEARGELERALAIWDELAPQGHPRAVATLEALASLSGPESRYRSRAEAIRAGLL
ncbi:MAG: protein kinase [Enhygromyxa sp.]